MASTQSKNFGEKYLLLDHIGTGGMAEVYRCKMSGTMGFEKLVVVKKLLSQFVGNAEVVSQFIAEARLAALLQHENIAYVYDFGEIDGSYFIAMEYLLGKDLHSVMQKATEMQSPIGVERAVMIAMKICEGMDYAHSLKDLQQRPLNIIHRDLSPHNVFITYEGKVKIIDFGIAKAELFDNQTKVGMVKGKISYMSPEQLTAEKIDRRSDIFCIGILLYEMLCGQRMYSGDTAALIRKCMLVEYEKLETIQPGLHPAIYRILDKALAKDPGERYESCAQMRTDLEDCLFKITGRPALDTLQGYILGLFQGEVEAEKHQISSGMPEPLPGTATTFALFDQVVPQQPAAPDRTTTTLLPERPWRQMHRWAILIALGFVGLAAFMAFSSGQSEIQTKTAAPAAIAQSVTAADSPAESSAAQRAGGENPATVQMLLDEAAQAMAVGDPENRQLGIALDAYHQVLERQPDNAVALDGIRRIGEQYGKDAEQVMQAGKFSEAAEYLRKGLAVDPESPQLLDLQDRLAEQRRQEIGRLAARAETALANNQLTTPPEDSAYNYYQQILQLDGRNEQAKSGIQRIADRYAAMAEEAYRSMRIIAAKTYVRQGLAIAPEHKHLLQLQRDLSRSKPGILFKSIEKSVRPIFQ